MATNRKPSSKNKNVGPHTLRHTTAMRLLQAGNELNMARLWLGHASPNTTHMHIEVDMGMKRAILNKARPIESERGKEKWKNPEMLEWLDELCKEEVELCAD